MVRSCAVGSLRSVAAACSSGGGNESTPTSAARTATTVAGVTGFEKGRNPPLIVSVSASSTTVGTPTTLSEKAGARVGPAFTTAVPPATTVSLRNGLLLLAPPGASDVPKTTAAAAFRNCGGNAPIRRVPPLVSPTVELTRATLKDYGHVNANGSVTPVIGRRLVWIIWYKSQTIDFEGNQGPTGPQGLTSATPTTLHFKEDIMTFVDARTGGCLNTEGFAP